MFTENVYKGTLIQNYNQEQENFSMPIWRQTHTFKVYNIQQMNPKTNGKLKQYHHKIYLPYPAIRKMSFQDIQKMDNIYSGCLKLSIFLFGKMYCEVINPWKNFIFPITCTCESAGSQIQELRIKWVSSGLPSHLLLWYTETGPRFKVSSKKTEEVGDWICDPWIGSLAY